MKEEGGWGRKARRKRRWQGGNRASVIEPSKQRRQEQETKEATKYHEEQVRELCLGVDVART